MSRYLRNIIIASLAVHVIILLGGMVYYEFFYEAPKVDDRPVAKNSSSGGGSGGGGSTSRQSAGGGTPSAAVEVALKELPDDPNAKTDAELKDFAAAAADRLKDKSDQEKLDELNSSVAAIDLENKDPEQVKELAAKSINLITGENVDPSTIDRKVSTNPDDHFEVDENKPIPSTKEGLQKELEQSKNINKFDVKSSYPHDMVLEDGWYKYIMIDKNGRTLKVKHKKAEDMTEQDMNEYKVLKMGKNKNMRLLMNALFEAGNKKQQREEEERKAAEEAKKQASSTEEKDPDKTTDANE